MSASLSNHRTVWNWEIPLTWKQLHVHTILHRLLTTKAVVFSQYYTEALVKFTTFYKQQSWWNTIFTIHLVSRPKHYFQTCQVAWCQLFQHQQLQVHWCLSRARYFNQGRRVPDWRLVFLQHMVVDDGARIAWIVSGQMWKRAGKIWPTGLERGVLSALR